MHSANAPTHSVVSCGVEVVEWTRSGAVCTGVEVVNITAVCVTIVHVGKPLDGIWGCDLCRRWASGEVLLVIVASTSSSSTSSTSIVGEVVVAWSVGGLRRIHRWACHDGVTHLL